MGVGVGVVRDAVTFQASAAMCGALIGVGGEDIDGA